MTADGVVTRSARHGAALGGTSTRVNAAAGGSGRKPLVRSTSRSPVDPRSRRRAVDAPGGGHLRARGERRVTIALTNSAVVVPEPARSSIRGRSTAPARTRRAGDRRPGRRSGSARGARGGRAPRGARRDHDRQLLHRVGVGSQGERDDTADAGVPGACSAARPPMECPTSTTAPDRSAHRSPPANSTSATGWRRPVPPRYR
jgi:hypothetical protein